MFPFTWKNYLLCFSNVRSLPSMTLPNSSSSNQSRNHNTTSTTLIKNFNSLYDLTSTSTSILSSSADHDFFSNFSDISSDTNESPPDFATVFASQRFFFSSPGRSNSIFDSPNSPPCTGSNTIVSGSVAIQTDSPNPFQDFRTSMQEMVEAQGIKDIKADWKFLHELLLCYLTLNPKHTHKFIIKAFSDLLVSLMSSESWQQIEDHRHRPTSQRAKSKQLLRYRDFDLFGELEPIPTVLCDSLQKFGYLIIV